MSLNYFFNPKAIAVIGASSQKDKLGRQVLDNIIKGGYGGKIYPVNLKKKKIAHLVSYTDIADVPIKKFNSLLVVIAIPARFVMTEVEKCARLGIKNIIIISAGFKEAGAEGKILENSLSQVANKYHLNVLGPNCLGFINNFNKLNATFANTDGQKGNIAIISQSGAIGSATLDWLQQRKIGLGYFLSLGNKAKINENDILEYLAHDNKINLIGIYLEEIENGEKLMNLVSRLSKKKPVVVLKAGQSIAGSKLAVSHTGSLAGSREVIQAGLDRAGAISVNGLEELLNILPLAKKDYFAAVTKKELHLVTNAGGLAVLTADAVSREGLELKSSIDVLGDAPALRYRKTLEGLLKRKEVKNVLVLLTPQTMTEPEKTAEVIVSFSKKYPKKIIIASFVGGELVTQATNILRQNKVPVFDFPTEAIASLNSLLCYKVQKDRLKVYNSHQAKQPDAINSIDYLSSLNILKKYGIKSVPTHRLDRTSIAGIKYPVALKIVGPDFVHKSDKQAVVLGLNNKRELLGAVERLKTAHKKELLDKNNYLVIQKEVIGAQEIILGIKRDPSFGPLVMIGLGGIYTETFKEIKMSIADFGLSQAKEIIKELKVYPILKGARGQKQYDVPALANNLVNLSRLANEHPEIQELDINPLFVQRKGALAGDVRIVI